MPTDRSQVEQLAELYGLQTSFIDTWQRPRTVSTEALIDTCRLLGANLEKMDHVPEAIRQRQQDISRQTLEPVNVVWEHAHASVMLRVSEFQRQARFQWHLELEDGLTTEASGSISELSMIREETSAAGSYAVLRLPLPDILPRGYHRLFLKINGNASESLIIAAPSETFSFPSLSNRHWGAFLPLYSLHRKRSSATATLTDLGELMQWTADCGGSFVASLPLLSTLWELNEDPSPYQPTSRLFWNEFYLDLKQIPEYSQLSGLYTSESKEQRKSDLVNYAEEMRHKRRVLELMAEGFFQNPGPRQEDLFRHCETDPELELFARFRATGERQGRSWTQWPERLRRGEISSGDYDQKAFQFHLFTQWQMKQQLAEIKHHADERGLLWYLDYPVGVRGGGYDVWRNQDVFVREADGGAPPDNFFTKGQNWGFPPIHPQKLREQQYAYFIQALRAHLQNARVLRLDHVMGLYRFYWIPQGHGADDGAYVRYPLEEMVAILAVESHRYGARIIGENLGTVPDEVGTALARHNIDGMYVLQFQTNVDDPDQTFRPVPSRVAASLNTHDTPPFAAYWEGSDIEDRASQELLTEKEAIEERKQRETLRERVIEYLQREHLLEDDEPSVSEVLSACLAFLARSDAEFVMVNLEDLWNEKQPQNRPGTAGEYPNWRRRARYSLEEFRDRPEVREVLSRVARLRAEGTTSEKNQDS